MKLIPIYLTFAVVIPCASAQVRHYYAAIDLGSRGTKCALYSFEREAEGRDARVIFSKTINTSLVSGASTKAADGNPEMRFAPKGIEEAADAVKQEMDMMRAEVKRNLDNLQRLTAGARKEAADLRVKLAAAKAATTPDPAAIKTMETAIHSADVNASVWSSRIKGLNVAIYYVVGSSGVARGKNTNELAAAVKTAAGIDMSFVDAKNEARYGLISAIPEPRQKDSALVDVGSGNTKMGCMAGDSFKATEIPYGSVSGANAGKDQSPDDIPAGIEAFLKGKLAPAYKQESLNYPCLANRARIYWIGGAAWATATYMHPEKALTGYVVMPRAELEAFISNLKDNSWNAPLGTLTFPKGTDAKEQSEIRKKAEADRLDVSNVFVREQLLAGTGIMKAIIDAGNPSAEMVFARNGNYLYGYAVEKYREDREATMPPPKNGAATKGAKKK